MLLNKHQKEQFKTDYTILNYVQLQVKYRASAVKIRELAKAIGIDKPIGRPLGTKDTYYRERKTKN
jgi:hypothetical protein